MTQPKLAPFLALFPLLDGPFSCVTSAGDTTGDTTGSVTANRPNPSIRLARGETPRAPSLHMDTLAMAATVTLGSTVTLMISSCLIPLLTLVVTKYSAANIIKQVVATALAGLATIFNQSVIEGVAILQWSTLVLWFFQTLTALAVYVLALKPNNVAIAPGVGIGPSAAKFDVYGATGSDSTVPTVGNLEGDAKGGPRQD
jgi:hypothetical protein